MFITMNYDCVLIKQCWKLISQYLRYCGIAFLPYIMINLCTTTICDMRVGKRKAGSLKRKILHSILAYAFCDPWSRNLIICGRETRASESPCNNLWLQKWLRTYDKATRESSVVDRQRSNRFQYFKRYCCKNGSRKVSRRIFPEETSSIFFTDYRIDLEIH